MDDTPFFSHQAYGNENALYVALRGRLNRHDVETAGRAIQSLLNQPQKRVYVSLHDLRSIDSAGLGLLVQMNSRLRKQGREMVVLQPSMDVGRLLHMSKLELLMQIEEGLAADRVRREMEREELAIEPQAEGQ